MLKKVCKQIIDHRIKLILGITLVTITVEVTNLDKDIFIVQ